MHASVLAYARAMLGPAECEGARVIELGSFNVNGTVRPIVESWQPKSYLGVDMEAGPGVDLVADVCAWTPDMPPFDLVVSTEALEHVENWRAFVRAMKGLTRTDGLMFVTTRSEGFPFHPFPVDCWRYSQDDMRDIFADCDILDLCDDDEQPGVFMLARKTNRPEAPLDEIHLQRAPQTR